MSEFTVRTRKFLNNPLLGRKQFVLDVIHPGIWRQVLEHNRLSLS